MIIVNRKGAHPKIKCSFSAELKGWREREIDVFKGAWRTKERERKNKNVFSEIGWDTFSEGVKKKTIKEIHEGFQGGYMRYHPMDDGTGLA